MRSAPLNLARYTLLLLVWNCPVLRATPTLARTTQLPQALTISSPVEASGRLLLLQSLRRDVAAHPENFITFETKASASRFIEDHAPDAQRETDARVIARGIVGYCGGKLLVVLPTLVGTNAG